jgi:hypothetical protein
MPGLLLTWAMDDAGFPFATATTTVVVSGALFISRASETDRG